MEQVINEWAIYDIVDVTGLVYNLQTGAEHEKNGKPLHFRKGMIKDETGSIEIVAHPMISRKWECRNLWMIALWNQLKLQRFEKMIMLLFL